MKVIESSGRFTIFGDGVKIFDSIPPGFYEVAFNDMTGHFLRSHPGFKVIKKVYGSPANKVNKILHTFECSENNLGVIFSGEKGTGKTLSLGILSEKAIYEFNMPVLVINDRIPGLSGYLSRIEQDVVVVFDEFEKIFKNKDSKDGANSQEELLSLFDGVNSYGKKLFIITCNNSKLLNSFMINRPGRFHYHIQFNHPEESDVLEYLENNIKPEYHDQISHVINFSRMVNLNYDCLRAIVFEINMGEEFLNAIKDMNIVNTEDQRFDVKLEMRDRNEMIMCHGEYLNLYEPFERLEMTDYDKGMCIPIKFNTDNLLYEQGKSGTIVVNKEDIEFDGNPYFMIRENSLYGKDLEDYLKVYMKHIKDNMVCMKIRKELAHDIHFSRRRSAWGAVIQPEA